MLRVGVIGEDSNHARFSHVGEIDLRNHVTFKTLECGTATQYESLLAEQIGWHHDQLWQNVKSRPPWRIAVIQPSTSFEGVDPFQDMIFAYHHSLMDGISGRRFHEQLLFALNHPSKPACATATPHLLAFPDPPVLPEGQEDVVPFTNSASFVAKAVWSEYAPSFLQRKEVAWYGKNIDFSLPYKTLIRTFEIPPEAIPDIQRAGLEHSATLTPLIHGLALLSLASRLPPDAATSFASSTPMDLRPHLSPAAADPALAPLLRTLTTSTAHAFPAADVAALRRACSAPDRDREAWLAAGRVAGELRARRATLPADDPAAGLLR
jgi:hypothetical protein